MDTAQAVLSPIYSIQQHRSNIMSGFQYQQQRQRAQFRGTASTSSHQQNMQHRQSRSISPSMGAGAGRRLSHTFASPFSGRPSAHATHPHHEHQQQYRDSSPSGQPPGLPLPLPTLPATSTHYHDHDQAADHSACRRASLAVPETYSSALPPHHSSDVFPQSSSADDSTSTTIAAADWLPQDTLDFPDPSWFQLQNNNNNPHSEQPGFYSSPAFSNNNSQRQHHLSQSLSHPVPPSIRVTGTDRAAAQTFGTSQPLDATTSTSALPPTNYNNYLMQTAFSSGNLSPRPSSMPHDTENMQTPVSPVSAHNSPHDTNMGDLQQMSRKRSHSVMSQQDAAIQHALQNHSRAPSVTSPMGASPGEEYSPRGSRAFKRGDPPTNGAGKYICDFAAECEGQTFDRKCEWR